MLFKRLARLFLPLVLLMNLSFAQDYIVLKDGFDSKNSVIEIFSFKCIHCYNHHKFGTLSKLRDKLPRLRYELYPVSLVNGRFVKELNALFAFAQAKDDEVGRDASYEESLVHKLADYMFTLHFVAKRELESLSEIDQIALNVLNVSQKELEDFLRSDKAKEILRNYAKADELAKTYGTPSFIVNGEYQIKPEALSSMENLLMVVSELAQK